MAPLQPDGRVAIFNDKLNDFVSNFYELRFFFLSVCINAISPGGFLFFQFLGYYVFFLPFEFLSACFHYIWLCVSPATIAVICGYSVDVIWLRYTDLRLETLYIK